MSIRYPFHEFLVSLVDVECRSSPAAHGPKPQAGLIIRGDMKSVVDRTETGKARWEREVLEPTLKKSPERKGPFTTISGRPIERLYTPDDVAGIDYDRDIGDPGEFPYTRGIHPTGYRGKLWTMRQFAGFGTPEETNQRYKELIAAGGTGLSVAFDLPTLMGRDPDHRAVARRSREVRRQHRVARRHGARCSTASRSATDHDVDDDQLAGADDLRDVPGRGRAAGRRLEDDLRARSRTTSSRSSSPRRNTSSRRGRRCG